MEKMKDLIERQAAIDTEGFDEEVRCAMCRNQMKTDRGCDGNCKYNEKLYEKIMQILNERMKPLPSAQPERKKGRWIPVDSYSAFGGDEATWMAHGNPVAFYYCSECKEQAYAGEDGEPLLTDYCPNCGADMRGEEECC